MGDRDGFRAAVDIVAASTHFARDVSVSVFESNIRIIGGLLSGHLLANDSRLTLGCEGGEEPPPSVSWPSAAAPPSAATCGRRWYDGALLHLAVDLANRLLPAFDTRTGIPRHMVRATPALSSRARANPRPDTAVAGVRAARCT